MRHDFFITFNHELPAQTQQQEEQDKRRISQREKQLSFGKVTRGYRNLHYAIGMLEMDPDNVILRCIIAGLPNPEIPIPKQIMSKRTWDAIVAKWRKALHAWDDMSDQIEELSKGISKSEALQRTDVEIANANTIVSKISSVHSEEKIIEILRCLGITVQEKNTSSNRMFSTVSAEEESHNRNGLTPIIHNPRT